MRVLKDDIHNSILIAARNEFISKGFKDASMRDIARSAGVSLSNIYNYFKNKDELFLAVIKPAKDDIFAFIDLQHSEKNISFHGVTSFENQEESVEAYIQLIDRYREELRLLLFHSEGSSLKNFRDNFTDYLTQVSINYMSLLKKHHPRVHDVSEFFMHALCSWMVSILGEIITHDLDKQKIREFFREYFRYEISGWRELTGL